MSDPTFIEILCKHNLLSEEMKLVLESLSLSSEKIIYFLDYVMKPGLTDKNFLELLAAMKKSGYEAAENLAYNLQLTWIKVCTGNLQDLQGKRFISYFYNGTTGTYVVYLLRVTLLPQCTCVQLYVYTRIINKLTFLLVFKTNFEFKKE